MLHFARTLTGKTLLKIAVGVTLIIAVSSAVSYYLMYQDIQQRLLDHLTQYVSQRAKRYEIVFADARALHEALKDIVLKRMQEPVPPDTEQRFDQIYMRYPDGAVRNRPEFADGRRFPTGWMHVDAPRTLENKRLMVLFFDLAEQFGWAVRTRYVNLYFVTPDQINVGFDPNAPSWVFDAPADYPQNFQEFVYVAERRHNPKRETVWTGVDYDDIGKRFVVTTVTPIDENGRQVASVCTDVDIAAFTQDMVASELPGAWHAVFRADGKLIAHTHLTREIIQQDGELRIPEAGDVQLATLFRKLTPSTRLPLTGHDDQTDTYFAVNLLQTTGWYFVSMMPGNLVRAQAFRASQWVLWAGLASLILLLGILAVILGRQIGRPLRELLGAAQRVAAGESDIRLRPGGADEVGQLAAAFNDMVERVNERDVALRVEKDSLRQALAQVQHMEERFRALTEHISDVTCIVDARGVIQYMSPSLEGVLGYAPEQRVGQPPFDVVHADDHKRVRAIHAEVLQSRYLRSRTAQYQVRHADGTWRTIDATWTNMMANPAVNGIVVTFRDVSDQVRAQEEINRQREALHQSEKMSAMGTLLAGVAHELNNPLSVVVGRSIMLEESGDPSTRSAAERIRTAAERCAKIVKTFLAMARQHEPVRSPIRLNELIKEALDMVSYGIRTSGIRIVVDLAADLPEIAADADQLHQVFINLFINAQQALADHPGPRELRIATHYDRSNDVVRATVSDTGPGIAEPIQSRIFEPYFTTKPTGVGTGVGLSVSLGIVAAHGGTLSLEGNSGSGATFCITLPAGPVNASRPETAETASAPEPCRSILIVDDEVEIGEMLAEILACDDHHIEVAFNGREALERLRQREFDLVISDLRMPELDGPGLYREIERFKPELIERIVFITGDTLSGTVSTFLAEIGRPVIEKPFVPAEVRRIIAAVQLAQKERA